MTVTTEPSGELVTPKANRGLAIDDQPGSRERLRRDLGRFNPDSAYLAIIVSKDSFSEFQHVKSLAVELGFEYRIIPLEWEERIPLQGGAGGDVQ